MSKYATPDCRSINYSGKITPVHDDWRIVFTEEDDGLVHEGDMLMTYDGTFMHPDKGMGSISEVGATVESKICVIRKIDKTVVAEPVAKRMKQKEFISELNGLHS